jgi:S-adenosylmethionine:tRNA ribosyltransferase-isomerase
LTKPIPLSDFSYTLPDKLIASQPPEQRSASKLLCLNATTGAMQHRIFRDLTDMINPDDLLVFNDTRVIPARLYGVKQTGGKVEVLVERLLDNNTALVQIKASKAPQPGTRLLFDAGPESSQSSALPLVATVIKREKEFFQVQFECQNSLTDVLEEIGHIPLPPYIKRSDVAMDKERYQTIYAKRKGAVAAPTAGLHFDEALLERLRDKGVEFGFVTLHVGAGTFQSIRVNNILEHKMHAEIIEVTNSLCNQISACRKRGGRVIAVGTTTVRSLESTMGENEVCPYQGETDIFIYPGYKIRAVDAMITNFHLPESTLMMLVSAFSDINMLLGAYEEAIKNEYRFFSYGDAMFIYHNGE